MKYEGEFAAMKLIIFLAVSIVVLLFTPKFSKAQWIQTSLMNADVRAVAVSGTNIFAGGSSIFLSTDSGTSWTAMDTGLVIPYLVSSFAVSGASTSSPILFAGAQNGVYRSTNSGGNWTAVNTGLIDTNVHALGVRGPNLFVAAGGGVFRSTNNGISWTAAGLEAVNAFAGIGAYLFAGGDSVFLSLNDGMSWTPASTVPTRLSRNVVFAFAVKDTNSSSPMLFVGTGDGVFLSTNYGANWTPASNGLTSTPLTLATSGTNLFAGTAGGGVFLSTNNGSSWTAVNAGLKISAWDYAFAVSGKDLYVGTGGTGVWKRPLSELTSSGVSASEKPVTFKLERNYPNPFNPSTIISFILAERGMVQLDVFDMLGRKIQVLEHSVMDVGLHRVQFDAGNLASGIYTAQLISNNARRELKMILSR